VIATNIDITPAHLMAKMMNNCNIFAKLRIGMLRIGLHTLLSRTISFRKLIRHVNLNDFTTTPSLEKIWM